jgi:putative hydrolase of the HAD superfamily
MPYTDRQHLIFDADDTLWENNRYFEESFAEFVAFLNHDHLTAADIRDILDVYQRQNRDSLGYGSHSFATSLRQAYIQIVQATEDDPRLTDVERLGLRILEQVMEPIADVPDTLVELRPHHDLILLTKGNPAEQQAKIERSNLADIFDASIVVTEKHADTYRELVDERQFDPAKTWMIGNSPKSDINPALQAHINAVFIPHPLTWHLEIEEIAHIRDVHPGELIQLDRFADLRGLFLPQE